MNSSRIRTCALFASLVGCASTPAPGASSPPSVPPPSGAVAAPAAAIAPAGLATPSRTVDQILGDYIEATGGRAAYESHKSVESKATMVFKGMGLSGTIERVATSANKAYTTTTLPGMGTPREGSNGTVAWSQDPINGLRILDGAEAEQALLEDAWNADLRLKELYARVALAVPSDDTKGMECIDLAPKMGPTQTRCFDPETHLMVLQKGLRATPQGNTPFSSTSKDWREVGGVKMPYLIVTQVGTSISVETRFTEVSFDKSYDDEMFEVPTAAAPPAPGDAKPAVDARPAKKKHKAPKK